MARVIPQGYESKFAEFIRLCAEASADDIGHVVIARPWVLDYTCDEILESGSRLTEAGLSLQVADK